MLDSVKEHDDNYRHRRRRRRRSSRSRSPSSSSAGTSPRKKHSHHKRHSSKSDRDRERERAPERERRPEKPRSRSPRRRLPDAAEILRREQEQIERDQRTVFASQIHPKTTMREIFEFFSQVGRVRDVQCIEDQRTRKFKGIAYVEMDTVETVPLALALNGHLLGGFPVNVQLTQAEKNRAAQQAALAAAALQEQPMRVRVQNLPQDVTEEDLRPFFDAFGRIDDVAIDLDSSGKSLGSAWVTFRRVPEAQAAVSALNGLEVLGQNIAVTMEVPLIGVGDYSMGSSSGGMNGSSQGMGASMGQLGELDDDSGGGLHLSAQHRLALMQRLQRSGTEQPSQSLQQASQAIPQPHVPVRVQPTTCIVLKNMFSKQEIQQDDELAADIKEDVQSEASKYGRLLHIYVDHDSDGHVFLRYADVDSAMKSFQDFNGRFFAARQVLAEYVIERSYESRFPGSGQF